MFDRRQAEPHSWELHPASQEDLWVMWLRVWLLSFCCP